MQIRSERFGKRTYRINSLGYRGPARYNRLLAAERFSASMGYRTQSHPGFYKLPPTDHALVLPGAALRPNSKLNRRLSQWVREGGHLIFLMRNAVRSERRSGLAFDATEEPEKKDPWVSFVAQFGIRTADRQTSLADTFHTRYGQKMIMRIGPGMRFSSAVESASCWVGDRESAGLLSVPAGQGRLTMVSDAEAWTNQKIGEADHARALWYVLGQDAHRAGVWFIYDSQSHFLLMLWMRFWPPIVALGLLLVVWLWRSAGRFGPLQAAESTSNRRFVEHIRATGRFLWRRRCAATLIEAPRKRLLRRIRLRFPETDHLEPTKLDAMVAARCGLIADIA